MRQLPLPVRLRPSSIFGGFFPGPNAQAIRQLAALRAGEKPTAIWLYGPKGVGKSHLLQAICAQASAQDKQAAYLPMQDIARLDPRSLVECESHAFICIDDVAIVAGDPEWERALFGLYTLADEAGGRVIFSAPSPPNACGFALRDLASRVAAGCLVRLEPLNDEEQLLALQARAAQLGLELPTEAAQYLLRRLPRDMATLCDALEALDVASLATQRRLTLPFVREYLERRG